MPSFGDVLEFVGNIAKDSQMNYIRRFKSFLRTKTDQEIRNGLRNISQTDWRYQYVYEEARRRRLV